MPPRQGGDQVTDSQIRPVGIEPSIADLLVGSLLYSTVAEVVEVGRFVDLDDLDEPGRTVLASVKALAGIGVPPSPQLVRDDLKRKGRLTRQVGVWLASATTSGACSSAARNYAAAVVSESLRRQVESFGSALTSSAATASEADVTALVDAAAKRIRYVAGRLEELRGDAE
jgi:replicative DNA helicase